MQRRRRFTPVARNFLLIGLLVLVVFFVVLDGAILDLLLGVRAAVGDGTSSSGVLRVGLGVVAVVVASGAFVRARSRERARRGRFVNSSNVVGRVAANPVFGESPSYEQLRQAMSDVRGKYLDEALGLFATMLIDPTYRVRMSERLTLTRSRVRKSSRAEYAVSNAEKESIAHRVVGMTTPTIIVPLMPVKKGSLLGDLTITDAGGNRLAELPQDRVMGLMAIVLRSYFILSFEDVLEGEGDQQRIKPVAKLCLWRLRQLICYRGIVEPDTLLAEFENAIADLKPRGLNEFDRFRRFCLYFAENYYMACEVPMPAGSSVDVIISSSSSLSPSRSTGSRMRTFFGMEPHRITIPIDLAEFWPNYHAELDGEERLQFVYRQQVIDEDERADVDESYLSRRDLDGQLIYQSEPGRINPRINVRNFHNPSYPRLVWSVSFDEVPPGAMAPVLALSLTTTVLTFCFAFIVPQVDNTEFDASALVVAIPLFVTSFFGFSFDKLTRSSLPTVFSFASTSVLVVITAMIVLVSSDKGPAVTSGQRVLGFLSIGGFSWPLLVCALISLTISINQTFVTVRRTTRYSALLERDDGRR